MQNKNQPLATTKLATTAFTSIISAIPLLLIVTNSTIKNTKITKNLSHKTKKYATMELRHSIMSKQMGIIYSTAMLVPLGTRRGYPFRYS